MTTRKIGVLYVMTTMVEKHAANVPIQIRRPMGMLTSTTSTSRENLSRIRFCHDGSVLNSGRRGRYRLTMRPMGVVSKKDIGARMMLSRSWQWRSREAPTHPTASEIALPIVPIATEQKPMYLYILKTFSKI